MKHDPDCGAHPDSSQLLQDEEAQTFPSQPDMTVRTFEPASIEADYRELTRLRAEVRRLEAHRAKREP
jgi:hypothetical protein